MGSMGIYSSSSPSPLVSDSSIHSDLLLAIIGFFLGGSEVGSGGSEIHMQILKYYGDF